ncbi:hypothetical protein GPLA_1744 [Paraglaciecola polaris LMG 21857]|uniref:Uncharacterized protein n=1 Tax=Paraglaciecola polaris LMG 21857 TaxID=1129793 RepID=K6YIU3_9ALTE|nr:hypothetical protein GPLA_1744 [Paraglaciecola polaris LMG 21857]
MNITYLIDFIFTNGFHKTITYKLNAAFCNHKLQANFVGTVYAYQAAFGIRAFA